MTPGPARTPRSCRAPALPGTDGPHSDSAGSTGEAHGGAPNDAAEERLRRVEARLAALEERIGVAAISSGAGRSPGDPVDKPGDDDPYFALHALQARVPAPGAVLYTGSVDLPDGHVEWQYAQPTGALLDDDWTERSATIAALAHPVRLRILQLVVEGVATVADLSEMDDLGTTGQVYHHVRQLTGAGWLEAAGRGRYRVPAPRVVPLLTVLLAAR